MAYLMLKTPDGVRKVKLQDEAVTIGRHPECGIVVDDDRSSRRHCIVEPMNGGFRVRDLGSRNGTKVNDRRVEYKDLADRDIIRIGKVKIRYMDPEAAKRPVNAPDFASALTAEDAFASSLLDHRRPGVTLDLEEVASHGRTDYRDNLKEIIRTGGDRDLKSRHLSLIDARGEVLHQAELEEEQKKKKSKRRGGEADAEDDLKEGISALRLLLLACLTARATDLHLEPKREQAVARLRVDGYMVNATELTTEVHQKIVGLVKVLCQIEHTRRNIVQEGHFSVALPKRRIDYRVSFTPSVHGQKLVIRVLDTANAPTRMHELGMVAWMYDKLRSLVMRDSGMILAAGPTGSGKTTTLYSCLREIDAEQRNVITIEDPVEYSLDGCTQIPVDHDQGNGFGTLLRSVMRQDPDVILVGEIRDLETARTATQAAMTGHLVFSTVHAKDTIGGIFRLLDLGLEPYLVANSMSLLIAQRLVRLLCENCRKPVKPTPPQVIRMGRFLDGIHTIYNPTGCRKCLRTGFLGRRAIFEMLEFNDELRDCVLNQPSIHKIRQTVNRGLFHTLQESGFQLVAKGITSYDEIDRVAGND